MRYGLDSRHDIRAAIGYRTIFTVRDRMEMEQAAYNMAPLALLAIPAAVAKIKRIDKEVNFDR